MGWLPVKSLAPRWGYLPKALYQNCWGRKSNVDFWWITSIESLLFGSLFWGCLKTQFGSGEEQVAKLAEDNCILPLASLFFSRFGVAKCQEIEGLAERGGLICLLSEGLQPLKWLESTTDHPVEPIRKELSIARQKLRASQRRKSRGLEICRLGEWRQQCEKLVAGYDVYWDICTRVNSISFCQGVPLLNGKRLCLLVIFDIPFGYLTFSKGLLEQKMFKTLLVSWLCSCGLLSDFLWEWVDLSLQLLSMWTCHGCRTGWRHVGVQVHVASWNWGRESTEHHQATIQVLLWRWGSAGTKISLGIVTFCLGSICLFVSRWRNPNLFYICLPPNWLRLDQPQSRKQTQTSKFISKKDLYSQNIQSIFVAPRHYLTTDTPWISMDIVRRCSFASKIWAMKMDPEHVGMPLAKSIGSTWKVKDQQHHCSFLNVEFRLVFSLIVILKCCISWF